MASKWQCSSVSHSKMTTTFEEIPDNVLLDHIVTYLSIPERCRVFGMNRRLFFSVKDEFERSIETLTISENEDELAEKMLPAPWKRVLGSSWPRRMIQQNCSWSLHTLELNSHCTDGFLEYASQENLFPKLTNLSMERSMGVTDEGLKWLSRHPSAKLEQINLTFCNNTTYAGTFCLRDRYKDSLTILRRQPKWLDGHTHTPFGDDEQDGNAPPEIHTYYPDGTFSFTSGSKGFVAELKEWENDQDKTSIDCCLVAKLQFSNFVPQPGWPPFTEFSYRPGVCLFPLPDDETEDENGTTVIRSILVGQNLNCLRPDAKTICALVTKAMGFLSSMDTGESVFSSGDDGIALAHNDPSIMISRMKVNLLESSEMMPPGHLVGECKRTCREIESIGIQVLDRFEEDLHRHFESQI